MATRRVGSGRSERRRYTAEEKRKIVQDAERMGVCAAAKKHGVHQSNVSRWKARSNTEATNPSEPKPSEMRKRRADAKETRPAETSKRPRSKTVKGARATPASARRVAKKYTPTQVAQAIEYAAQHGVTAASKELGMSRYAIHDWLTKARRAAVGAEPSPTSGAAPEDIEAQRDAEVLAEWKRHPGLGPSQVRNQLRRKGVKVSTRTVRRVMEDAGYRPPRVKRKCAGSA
jgi:transposase-like protein